MLLLWLFCGIRQLVGAALTNAQSALAFGRDTLTLYGLAGGVDGAGAAPFHQHGQGSFASSRTRRQLLCDSFSLWFLII